MAGELLNTVYRPVTTQKVTTSGTSAATSNAIGNGIYVVRLVCTEECYIAIGASPTATANDFLLPADTVEYFGIRGGQKVAALQVSTGGTLFVTEMTS